MACLHPITVSTDVGNVHVACKQCLPCRILRQSQLTARCLLEDITGSNGLFLTLTFREEPEDKDYKHFSAFLKRLRRHEEYRGNPLMIRFLCVGEFGAKSGRFHAHLLVWNTRHLDEVSLGKLWPHGFVYIGQVTPKSIRYTARYTLKFQDKGLEAHAGWSARPPLGAPGVRYVAQKMLDQSRTFKTAPCLIQLQGKSYPLDRLMKREFMRAVTKDDSWDFPNSGIAAHSNYLETMVLGDPIEAERKVRASKLHKLETATHVYAKI